jgi:hypothetical protein
MKRETTKRGAITLNEELKEKLGFSSRKTYHKMRFKLNQGQKKGEEKKRIH